MFCLWGFNLATYVLLMGGLSLAFGFCLGGSRAMCGLLMWRFRFWGVGLPLAQTDPMMLMMLGRPLPLGLK